ncbi:hypothetical protein RHODOSMS8_02717 [Rhodobiaceae bacterium]|nr:hypothetical protein RHODOSMS8_02717 [Rhodobiaceae bacterium]
MSNLSQVQESGSGVETSSGLFRFFCVRVGGSNTPLGHFIGPLGQYAGGFAERRLLAGFFINETHRDRIAGAVADILHGCPTTGLHSPGLAPLGHSENYLPVGFSGFGWLIFMARRIGLVSPAGEQSFRREFVQPIGQNVCRDPQGFHQFVEPAKAQQQIAKDQDAPAVAEHRHRRRNWARGALIIFRSGTRFISARLFAGARVPRLPIRFPHGLSLATFVPQVDSADGHLVWNLAK